MSVQQSASSDPIPLRCIICPKKPRFSDLSHLLTHLSSKAHLSHYFKADTKGDPETQSRLEDFKAWYNKYGLKELLATRLEQKESKKAQSANQSSKSIPAAPSRRGAKRQREEASEYEPEPARQPGEHPDYYTTLPTGYYPIDQVLSPDYTPTYPWSAYPPVDAHAQQAGCPIAKQESPGSEASDFNGSSPDYRYRRRRSTRTPAAIDDIQETAPGANVEAVKLKGIVWDGMHMFDSATPEMKRKRNQKKQYSVADQLKANSELILPSELVFDQVWMHRRTRLITGNPDDATDSPLEGEEPPESTEPAKKKATRRPRNPLASMDPNSRHPARGSSQQATRQPRNSRKKNVANVAEVEQDMTYGSALPTRSRTFGVHRDGTDGSMTSSIQASAAFNQHIQHNPFFGTAAQTIDGHSIHPLAMAHAYGYGFQRHPTFENPRSHEELLNLYSRGFSSFGHLNYNGQPVIPAAYFTGAYGHGPYAGYTQQPHQGFDPNVENRITPDIFQQQEASAWMTSATANQDMNIPDTQDEGFTLQDESQATTTTSTELAGEGRAATANDNDTISAPPSEH